MEYTKGELEKWLRAELVDLVTDIANVRASDMPEFNQGLDIICAYDTKVHKILERLSAPDLYEALKEMMSRFNRGTRFPLQSTIDKLNQALAKAEGK